VTRYCPGENRLTSKRPSASPRGGCPVGRSLASAGCTQIVGLETGTPGRLPRGRRCRRGGDRRIRPRRRRPCLRCPNAGIPLSERLSKRLKQISHTSCPGESATPPSTGGSVLYDLRRVACEDRVAALESGTAGPLNQPRPGGSVLQPTQRVSRPSSCSGVAVL